MEERMVLQLFKEVNDKLSDIKQTGENIEGHVAKTNGRVTKLERYQTGIVMCLSLIGFVVLPLLVYTFKISEDNLKYEILNKKALSAIVEDIINRTYNTK